MCKLQLIYNCETLNQIYILLVSIFQCPLPNSKNKNNSNNKTQLIIIHKIKLKIAETATRKALLFESFSQTDRLKPDRRFIHSVCLCILLADHTRRKKKTTKARISLSLPGREEKATKMPFISKIQRQSDYRKFSSNHPIVIDNGGSYFRIGYPNKTLFLLIKKF